MIRIGPAGWSYADWAGVVYPRPAPKGFDALEFMAGYMDTVEVNSTFYRPATAEVARKWVERVERNPRFRFTAKLWRRFTHERKNAWTVDEVREARQALDALQRGSRLGAVLIQFPWSFRNTDENRQWLDDVVRAFHDLPLVAEVRHASWSTTDFLMELTERGIGFANLDQPLFRDSIGPSAHVTSRVGYIRVHGRNYQNWWRKSASVEERYDYLYSADELRPWAARAMEIENAAGTDDTYVITNNHYRGKAVANALMLASMTTEQKIAAPGTLIAEYSGVMQDFVVPGEPGHTFSPAAGGAVPCPRRRPDPREAPGA
jgi:uncharacterized protein YecE (DUF72 family)